MVGPRVLRMLDRPTVVTRNPDRARQSIGHLAGRIVGCLGQAGADGGGTGVYRLSDGSVVAADTDADGAAFVEAALRER